MKFCRLTVFLCVLLLAPASALALDAAKEADVIYKAMSSGQKLPISTVPEVDQTMDNAYRVQAELVKMLVRNDPIVGFKGGLTAKAQFARFKASSPTSAPIFKSGLILVDNPQEAVTLKAFPGIMLENEFVFKTAQAIKSPVTDAESLKTRIASVHAGIEVPCLNFEDMSRLFVYDLTAAGVGTKIFIVGPAHDPAKIDLDAMEVVLTRDDVEVNRGRGSDALGSQWEALLWLVNAAVAHHDGVEAGQYLFTGALGKMIPAKPGSYVVTFPIDTLKFEITQ